MRPNLAPDWWIALMVSIHLMLGLAMAWIAMSRPGFNWPFWMVLPFMALAASEILLLGMWLGFSQAAWWQKLGGFLIGLVWLTFLTISPMPPRQWRMADIDNFAGPVTVVVLAVAGASLCCRYLVARIVHRSDWPVRPLATELQFSLRSIIALTIVVAVLLALRNVLHWVRSGSDAFAIAVFILVALLSSTMLPWACLGTGRVAVRIPLLLLGMAALGLIFPYYLSSSPSALY